MNILWASNYESISGYSQQARMFVPRLIRSGHNAKVVCLSNGSNMKKNIGGVDILPVFGSPFGLDSIPVYYEREHAHAVWTLIDQWIYAGGELKDVNWVAWTPVDQLLYESTIPNSLQYASMVVAMSQFGVQQLQAIGIDAKYVPLGYSEQIWFPGDKAQARARLGFPQDAFVAAFVGVNDSNPSRKGIPELLAAWKMFHNEHPDSILYMHTKEHGNIATGGVHAGVDIPMLMKQVGLPPGCVFTVDPAEYNMGIPPDKLAQIAHAADVLVSPSRGEGFGLPALEFQACGTPVISTNFSAQTEMNFAGWLVEGEMEYSWQGSWWMKPGVLSIYERLKQAYGERGNIKLRQQVADRARAYEVNRVLDKYMLPVMDDIAEMVLEAA